VVKGSLKCKRLSLIVSGFFSVRIRANIGKAMMDASVSSLINSTVSPKVKTLEKERVRVRFMARNTLGVEGHAGALGWD
jgi:hypothetical protein